MNVFFQNDPEKIPWMKSFSVAISQHLIGSKFELTAYYNVTGDQPESTLTIASSDSLVFTDKNWKSGVSRPIKHLEASGHFSVSLTAEDLNKVWAVRIQYSENGDQYDFRRSVLFGQVDLNLLKEGGREALFPERKLEAYKDRVDTGVCFSGGGTRAMLMAMGQMRHLHNSGLASRVGYYTSVSGGSWAATIYSFAAENNMDTLLGKSTLPKNYGSLIGTKELSSMAFGTQNGFFLQMLILNLAFVLNDYIMEQTDGTIPDSDKDAIGKFLEGAFRVSADRWWIESVGWAFFMNNGLFIPGNFSLDSFTLDDSSLDQVLANKGSLQHNLNASFKKVNIEREQGEYPPYYIANSLMLRPADGKNGRYIPYEYTPLYQGAGYNGYLKTGIFSSLNIGGGNASMFAYDTEVFTKEEKGKVWVMRQSNDSLASLATASGTSSSAFAGATSELSGISIRDILEYIIGLGQHEVADVLTSSAESAQKLMADQTPLKSVLGQKQMSVPSDIIKYIIQLAKWINSGLETLGALTPTADYFSPEQAVTKKINTEFNFGDAGLSDNFGLMSMLRRQVKKVVIFVNTETEFVHIDQETQIDETVKAYFGLIKKDGIGSGVRLSNMQVFQEEKYQQLIQDFMVCQSNGDPLVSRQSYQVQSNADWDVAGGYEVEVMWYYNCQPQKWTDQVEEKVLNELNNNGTSGVGKFPFYKTFPVTIKGLNPFEIQMLANIAEWNLQETSQELKQFIEQAVATEA